jgi:pimeloyl-ACP methyl ester carboxylesterase
MHFRRAGVRGSRSPLILLHQNPSSSLEYERLIEEMARDRLVVAFDTPGYGMSDSPPAPLSAADYAACFAEGADALGLFDGRGCDVFGLHTGSLLALELALAASGQIARVVVSGIPMRSAEERAVLLEKARTVPPLDEDGSGPLANAARLWDFIVVQRVPGVALRRAAQIWVDKLTPLERSSWAYQGVWGYDYARLAGVRQPVLLLQPEEPIAQVSRDAAALLPDAEIVDLDGYTRDLFDLPAAVSRLGAEMRRFLDTPL